jgi:hypothetical protein
MTLKSLKFLSAAVAACVITAAAIAADPSGSWTWTQPGRDGNPGRPQKLTLALKDGALTGSVSGRGGEIAISDASFKDNVVAFSVVRTFNDNSITIKYSGKLDGDTITGTIIRPGMDGGDPTTIDWKATRGAPDAAPPAGN